MFFGGAAYRAIGEMGQAELHLVLEGATAFAPFLHQPSGRNEHAPDAGKNAVAWRRQPSGPCIRLILSRSPTSEAARKAHSSARGLAKQSQEIE
jgi:hypothetical protein